MLIDNLWDWLAADTLGELETTDDRLLSAAAIRADVGRAAGALHSCGVRAGDRVCAQVEKSWPALALYLGCLKLGAVWTPLNTAYTPAEVRGFVEDAEPALLIVDPQSEGADLGAGPRRETLDADGRGSLGERLAGSDGDAPTTPVGSEAPAAIVYTSGTTGRSKGAVLSVGALAFTAQGLADAWAITAADTLLHALPIYHVHGLFLSLNPLLRAGGRVILRPRFDAADVLARLSDATVFAGVPTHYTRLLEQPGLTRAATGHMRLFISGSAPLTPETFNAFRDRTGHAPLERYGMTETGVIASNPLQGERVAGSVGFAMPGVDLRVVAEDSATLPAGEAGEIEVRGPNLFSTYWRRPEQTAAEHRPDGFFRTGDVGRLSADGRLEIVGRAKDLVISGGLNVYPKEVEAVLDAVPGVTETAVIGVPHPDFGEAVVAIVARPPTDDDALRTALTTAARERLAGFKRPKALILVDELPRNAMGKVQKAELRATHGGLFAKETL